LGLLLGGVLGAVVGILIAPKPGSETRAELAERSEVWRLRAEELAATLRERVGPAVEGMRERMAPAVEGVRERMGPAVEVVRERVGPVVQQMSARVGRSSEPTPTDGEHEAVPSSGGDGTKPDTSEEKT
jgi:gas vesicle protein